jgi:hypothetical protein
MFLMYSTPVAVNVGAEGKLHGILFLAEINRHINGQFIYKTGAVSGIKFACLRHDRNKSFVPFTAICVTYQAVIACPR